MKTVSERHPRSWTPADGGRRIVTVESHTGGEPFRVVVEGFPGEIAVGEEIVIESLIGSRFTGQVMETTTFGPHAAIVPQVSGHAHLIGRSEFFLDPADPLRHGFLLR